VAIAEASLAGALQVSNESSLQNTVVVRSRFGKKSATVAFYHRSSWKYSKHLVQVIIMYLFQSLPQSPLILILMIIFTLYAYLMPYKELLVNLVELAFQFLFLLFLLLRSTSFIIDSYQKFSPSQTEQCSYDSKDVTGLTWVVFPFAWLPVITCLLIACSFLLYWLSQ